MKDYSGYREAYRKRWQEEEALRKQRAVRAEAGARKAAEFLAGKYGVTRAVLFGSLPEGRFREGSDIDLGVEGLPKEKYIGALVGAEEAAGFPVDIKPLEDISESMRKRIEERGKVIYE